MAGQPVITIASFIKNKHTIAFALLHVWLNAHTLNFLAVLQLSELDVSANQITGTLPSLWSSLTQASILSSMSVVATMSSKQCILVGQ